MSVEAFVKGLHDIEMGSVTEATRIFNAFQNDNTGYINMKEFLFDIRFLSQVCNISFLSLTFPVFNKFLFLFILLDYR